MDIREMRENFDRQGPVYESHLLTLEWVDGYDVYNKSFQFRYE